LLQAKRIHKTYSDGKKEFAVLKGINLDIEEGKFISIVGPSGAGKSTLLNILGGLDAPTEGEVVFEEKNIYRLSDEEVSKIRNEKIGFVFQFYHLLSEFTVLENVMMPAIISTGLKTQGISLKERALELLAQTGLSERREHFPAQLSGGEKQRVAIVRALINNPSLLLCDEPTGNLDSATGAELVNLIRRLNQEKQMTVILVTHNLELAKMADKTYHLKDGILVN